MKTKEKLNNSRSPEMPIYCKWDFFLLKKVVHLEFFENSLGKRIFMLKSAPKKKKRYILKTVIFYQEFQLKRILNKF